MDLDQFLAPNPTDRESMLGMLFIQYKIINKNINMNFSKMHDMSLHPFSISTTKQCERLIMYINLTQRYL